MVRVSVKKTMLWGSLGLVLLMGLLIILPWFLNPEYVRSLVLQHIQQTLKSQVQVGRTSLALFPSPHFLVSDIVIKEHVDSHAVFRARSMSLELGIGQLLQKKIVVREFVLDHPEIEIHRDRLGDWRFLGHSNEEWSLSSLASFLVLGKIQVTNGKIVVIDQLPSDSVRGVVLEDVAWLSETSYEDVVVHSSLALSARLRQAQDTASFSFAGELQATASTPLSSLDGQTVLFEQVELSGHMEADNVAVNQLAEYIPQGTFLSQFPGSLNVESQITWVKNERGSHVHLSNIALATRAVTFTAHANIEELSDGHHMASVSMRSSTLDLENIRKSIPQSWLPDRVVNVWTTGEWGGELEVLEARVTASTHEDVETSVSGIFRVKNGFLRGADWPNTEHIHATVVVEPDRISVSEARGVYDGILVDVTKGILLLKESGPWGDVDIQGTVPAEKVWDFVRHIGESSPSAKVLESWKFPQGSGMLQLKFSGYVFDEEGLLFQKGDYQPRDVVFTIPGFPQPVTNVHGQILFSPDSTELEGLQGDVGGYPMTVDGAIIHQDALRFEPLHVAVGFDGAHVFAGLKQGTDESGFQVAGPLHMTVRMRGPMNRLKLKGKIDGEQAILSIPSVLRKAVGQAGTLEFDGHVDVGNTIRFERIELAMLPLRLRGQGLLRFGKQWGWRGRLNSGPISIELLPQKIRLLGNVIQAGILDVQLQGNGAGGDWRNWNVKGWVALTEGVVTIPGIQEDISRMFVRLRIDNDLLDLKRMEFRIKDSDAVVTGFMKHWKTTPEVSFMWDAPRFDVDLLVPTNERSMLRDGVEWLAQHGTLEGSFFVERPFYKTFSGKKLSATVKIHDNLVSVDNIQTAVDNDGNMKGRVFIHLPPGKPAAMRASFTGSHLSFQKILALAGDDRRFVTGYMDIQGMLQGHGRDARGVVPTLNGKIQISVRDGYVRQGVILPKILKILNLPHVLRGKVSFEKTGFPFDSVSTILNVEEGKFSTKDFLLRSPIMKTTVAGMYDLSRDHLDGVAAVSPFGAYSDMLKAIPLFGRIFSGDRKGIATAMFHMIGPLAEPQVTYMPKESLKTGLKGLAQLAFDILKNTVFAPVDSLSGSASKPKAALPESPRADSPIPSGTREPSERRLP